MTYTMVVNETNPKKLPNKNNGCNQLAEIHFNCSLKKLKICLKRKNYLFFYQNLNDLL